MAATVTKDAGETVLPGLGVCFTFKVLLDTSFAAGGEAIDLTDYVSNIKCAWVGGVDANADAAYAYNIVYPAYATAVTSSNVLISAYQSNNTVEALDEANTVDLSGVGALQIVVIGKAA